MPPTTPLPKLQPASLAAKVNAITPANDPELIYIVDELKKLKDRGYYGSVTLKLQAGCVTHYELQESLQVPVAARLPGVEQRQGL